MASAERPSADRRYERGSDEFSRVLAFSDGMFAIAMTLLVVGITVPVISDTDSVSDLADALNDLLPSIISFGISFAVIGRYWRAHHQMFSLLKSFDPGMIGLNLLYLGVIAFMPFPTDMLGEYFDNPLAVAVYALIVAVASGLEVLLLTHAHRNGLFERDMDQETFRWARVLALTPVATFLISIPFAFISSLAAVAVWVAGIPLGAAVTRRAPRTVDEYFS